MERRTLGNTQRVLPAIGLGCMGLSEFYGPPTEQGAAIKLLHEAIELGVEHFDTAEMYGIGSANETLLGEALHDRRDKVFIATKFGPTRDPVTGEFTGLDGSRENCRRAVEGSLKRLKTDVIDLYYLHRVDATTPIEETITAMAELVSVGKVQAIGLSEASGDTIHRATKIHPISAVQSEYSIFSRDIEASVIPACIEVGATLVAYSPLGRGGLRRHAHVGRAPRAVLERSGAGVRAHSARGGEDGRACVRGRGRAVGTLHRYDRDLLAHGIRHRHDGNA